jgi:hypothetical protein
MTIVPFSMIGPLTGTMRALVMDQVPPFALSLTSIAWLSMLKRLPGVGAAPAWPAPRPPASSASSVHGCFFFFNHVDARELHVAVVVGDAVDECLVDRRIRAEGMRVPDDDIRVLADVERADALIDAQLSRRIQRDHGDRLVVVHVAPPNRLRGFGVQAPRVFGAVRVDRDGHALGRHDGCVAGNRVFGFDLVAPPVGERGAAGAVRAISFATL